jgi:hypothetical protein
MFVSLLGLLALSRLFGQQPTSEQTRAVIARLAKEADQFERNAHRFTGKETLRQVQPAGTRFTKGPRGINAKLPESIRVVVSEYGYISADEPGGSLKEVRLILTVDGAKWKKGKKDLNALANQIGTRDAKDRAKTLEAYEDYGLRGFLSDAGQMILLFSGNGVEKYEFTFDRVESGGIQGDLWVYRYRQLDGDQALTIYGGKETIRHRMRGEYWARATDMTPFRVTLDATHLIDKSEIRDITMVDYKKSQWGILLPAQIDHRQYVDKQLFVIDQFSYSDFKQSQPGRMR